MALRRSVDDGTVCRRSGREWAVAAAVAYGGGFWLQGAFAVLHLGPVIPIWLVYTSGLCFMSQELCSYRRPIEYRC